jgi:AcrR family transcriptional regulator
MSKNEENTHEKILMSALTLFARQGIGKTSLEEVAFEAGVTRVTVYRYFADKKDLVHKTFLRVEQVFQDGLADIEENPELANWKRVMTQIGDRLGALPRADVFARSEELRRLYPDVYDAIQDVRTDTLNRMFDHLFTVAEQGDLLRPGLNRQIVQVIFFELIINFFDNPRFRSFGLSDAELYQVLTDIFLHGVFKN